MYRLIGRGLDAAAAALRFGRRARSAGSDGSGGAVGTESAPGLGIAAFSEDAYRAARSLYLRRLEQAVEAAAHAPIVVFQMGSVGSQTVYHSLQNFYGSRDPLTAPIFHMHYLSEARMAAFEHRHRSLFGSANPERVHRAWQAAFLRDALVARASGRRWSIITLVRDPIARNISDFFKQLEKAPVPGDTRWSVRSARYGLDATIDTAAPDTLHRLFLDRYDQASSLDYFDLEFGPALGVDVYADRFPVADRHLRLLHGKFDLLILRTEDLRRDGGRLLADFLRIKMLPLADANRSLDLAHGALWKSFSATLGAPADFLDRMYESKLARHFYDETERQSFRQRWGLGRR